MLVTMRLASNFITSRLFEGTILQPSHSQDNVLGGNYKKKAAQDELAEYCKVNSLTQPNYTLKATTDASSIHTNNDYSSAASSSMSLPQPLGSPFGVGAGGLQSVPELDPHYRLSLQLQQSYASSVEQLEKMYTCVVRFSSTELYHPAAGTTPQQYRFSTPRGAEFEDANQAREVAARVALQQLKRVANVNNNRRAWASVARRSAKAVEEAEAGQSTYQGTTLRALFVCTRYCLVNGIGFYPSLSSLHLPYTYIMCNEAGSSHNIL